jgi:ubiquinone/menaquinone biosynthesis C-methylase UbiE
MVRIRSPTALIAPLYDLLTAPLERRAFARWRRRLWSEVPPEGRGLEIGAGTGANFPFHPPGARIIATDISARMLREARGRREAARVPLVAADTQALPFADRSFDWVAETLVFCEVADPVRGLRELRRVLRPGGRLLMLEHVRPDGWLGAAADAITAVTGRLVGEHFNRRPERSLRAAGFVIERQEYLWRDLILLLVARCPAS